MEKRPFRIACESFRANLVPMVVLWCAAAATVLGYYFVPGVAGIFEPLRRWQAAYGWVAAFLNRVIFCGVLPGIFLLTVKSIRPRHPFAIVVAQTLWCGLWGILFDQFFALQAAWFGDDASFATLLLKTAVDQFVWTVLLIAPTNAVFFFWLGRDFSFRRARAEWPPHYCRDVYIPNLISNWIVWIPAQGIVYAFPLSLQLQISGVIGSFWMLVCLQIGSRSGRL